MRPKMLVDDKLTVVFTNIWHMTLGYQGDQVLGEQLSGLGGGGGGRVWNYWTTITTITAVSVTGGAATGVNDVKHAASRADTQTQDAKSRRSPTILSHEVQSSK